jgi:hypothetical protein
MTGIELGIGKKIENPDYEKAKKQNKISSHTSITHHSPW